MVFFSIAEFPDRFFIYDSPHPKEAIEKFIAEHRNKTWCDVVLVDSSQDQDSVRTYFRLFRSLATPMENLVVMNAHPKNVKRDPNRNDEVWEEMKAAGVIQEHFRCYFSVRDLSANQNGLLVGSYLL